MARKKDKFTPFPTTKYMGPKYFCDREEELKKLISIVENDRPVTIFSMRRMGKTGLVKHLQYHLEQSKGYICIYVDVFSTTSDEEFVQKLINAALTVLENSNKNFATDILKLFGRYTPKLTIDPITGIPGVELDIKDKSAVRMSLKTLFGLLNKQGKRVQIAIDEFQQIASYEGGSNMTAVMREYMQDVENVHFLFSGSQRHLLLDLFNNPKQPMYRMVDQLMLEEIDFDKYHDFIIDQFEHVGRSIEESVVCEVLNWTRRHTFYVQVVCNKLFAIPENIITEHELRQVKATIKKELEMNFLSYKKILSKNQFKVLSGIAKEGSVSSVRNKHFTNTYGLASSTAQQSLEYLVETELVYEMLSKEGDSYIVYDLFLERWLAEDDNNKRV